MTAGPIHSGDGRSDSPTTTVSRKWSDHLGSWSTRALQILILLTLVSVAVFALVQVKLVVIPVLIATILAAALSPVVMWLRRRGLKPILATWITLVAALVVFGGIVTLIVFAVRGQWDSLTTAAVSGFDDLRDYLSHLSLPIDSIDWDSVVSSVQGFLTSSQFGSGAIAGVSAAAQVVTGALLVFVLLFFFLKDGDSIWSFFLRPLNAARRARGVRIGHTAVHTLGGYVRGTAIVALADATGIGVGLAILQVPLALPLAVIVFFTSFIPLIGATLAGILAALVALFTNGIGAAIWVVAIVVLVNQLEGNLLQPVVMAQSLKLHPLVILVALTVGTILGGIVGAVLAVPLAAVGWAIIKVWNAPPAAAPPALDSEAPPEPSAAPVA